MQKWKKLLSCCLCIMLALSNIMPLAVAKGDVPTPTDQCEHTNTSTRTRYEEEANSVYQYNSSTHRVMVNKYEDVVCLDCDYVLSSTYMGQDENFIAHTMVDGVCSVCHWSGCEHYNATTEETLMNYGYCYPVDEYKHVFDISCWTIRTYCPDCDTVIYFNDQVERLNVQKPHTIQNGVCTMCNCDCQHTNLTYTNERHEKTGEVSSLDGLVHIVWENVYATPVCNDCGKVFDEVFRYEGSPEEAHTFVDGVCSGCGFVE